MRFFCSILAIMLLALNFIPCNDAMGALSAGATHIATEKNTHEKQQEKDAKHEDECSPFCQCACCSIVFSLPLSSSVHAPEVLLVEPKAADAYLQITPSGITLPIWQPPQLV